MSYRITGLAPQPFRPLFALGDAELARRGARRVVADEKPGFPCRVSLTDAEPGERLILLHYTHQPSDTPFRASHAIFVREGAVAAYDAVDRLPEVFTGRLLSVRAFDSEGMMLHAELAAGEQIEPLFGDFFADPAVAYLHVHYAKRACYAALVERSEPTLDAMIA